MLLSSRACGRLAPRIDPRTRAPLAMRPRRPLPSHTSSAPCDGSRLGGGARPVGVAPPLHSLGVVLSGGGCGRREPPIWSPPPRVPPPSSAGFWLAVATAPRAVGRWPLLSSRAVTNNYTMHAPYSVAALCARGYRARPYDCTLPFGRDSSRSRLKRSLI